MSSPTGDPTDSVVLSRGEMSSVINKRFVGLLVGEETPPPSRRHADPRELMARLAWALSGNLDNAIS